MQLGLVFFNIIFIVVFLHVQFCVFFIVILKAIVN